MTQSPPTGELVARHTWERRMRDKWLYPETIRLHAGECSRGEVFAAQAIAGLVITEAADAITTLERELEEARLQAAIIEGISNELDVELTASQAEVERLKKDADRVIANLLLLVPEDKAKSAHLWMEDAIRVRAALHVEEPAS